MARALHARAGGTAELITGAQVGLASPWLDGADVYWTESRPLEGGRVTLIRRDAGGARLAVLGSSQLAWNDSLVLWNRDLLLSALQWLAETQVRVGIAAKRPEQLRLSLQDDQQTRLFLILVLGLPLMAALLGVGVLWIRHR